MSTSNGEHVVTMAELVAGVKMFDPLVVMR